MIKNRELMNTDIRSWKKLANAFYALAHNDDKAWQKLPQELKNSDVGVLCEAYLETKDSDLIHQAGELLAGKHWYVALGR